MSIVNLARNLVRGEQGIWVSPSTADAVSYPDDGHSQCFQVEDRSFWFQHRNECIIAAIKKFPPSGGMLEIGGGNGYVTRRILDEGIECVLLEPGLVGALNAKRERRIPEVICSTLEAAQFEHGSLGAVGIFDVIEHIEDDRSIINQIYNLLQPGGLVYCTVPTHQYLWSAHDVKTGHFRRYSKTDIERLFADRFELVYFSYFFSVLTIPMYLLKTLPFKLLGGRSILAKKTEHGTGGGIGVAILHKLLGNEVNRIINGESINTGTSCLFVARKIGNHIQPADLG